MLLSQNIVDAILIDQQPAGLQLEDLLRWFSVGGGMYRSAEPLRG